MPFSVFYSWQSDRENATCRSFIEDSVRAAIGSLLSDADVQSALRDETLVFDKDTQGIPGMPPISQAIFDKISQCGLFVPDVTFVGTSDEGRLLCNPNVLIEYGWALSKVGHSRVVAVMNTAYGTPDRENLPFDMRHLRRPLCYELKEGATPEVRRDIKRTLTKMLVEAFRLVIKNLAPAVPSAPEFVPQVASTLGPSTFLPLGTAFRIHDGGQDQVPNLSSMSHAFLRLIPSKCGVAIRNAKAALDLVRAGSLRPMAQGNSGGRSQRNEYGAATFEHMQTEVPCLAQLFLSGELWGIESAGLKGDRLMANAETKFAFFPCSWLENLFVSTLAHFIAFSRNTLKSSGPLKLIVGVTNVRGYRMTAPSGMTFGGFERFAGNMIKDDLVWEARIDDSSMPPAQILRPFFDELWEECGLTRPDKAVL